LLATVFAAVAVAALLAVAARAAPQSGFLHVRRNLSETSRTSANPDLAVSPDGDWVAVGWIEEYVGGVGYVGHAFLRAASESGGGWGDKVSVYTGDGDACAYYKAAVAVTGTTAHVAYIVFEPCIPPSLTRVHYQTCTLTSGQCGDPTQIVSSTAYLISQVDLALDAAGNPHVVWVRYDENWDNGEIWYKSQTGGGWGDEEMIPTTGDDSREPAIACGSSRAHVVWWEESQDAIWYKWRNVDGSGGWTGERLYSANDPPSTGAVPPRNPDVAARGDDVVVVWDVRCDLLVIPEHEAYALLYKRSDDDGDNFDSIREVGTGWPGWWSLTPYEPIGGEKHLDPSIALNGDGDPAVVWHAGYSGGPYAVYYSYVVTDTGWITPTVLVEGEMGATAVGVGEDEESGQFLHIAYMEQRSAWDVYYNSDGAGDYEHVYLPLVSRNY
jgi:hypothetical protein